MGVVLGILRWGAALALVAVFIIGVVGASAQTTEPQPETLTILDVRVFDSVIEDDDALIVVRYQLEAGTGAALDVEDAFALRITPGSGAANFERGLEANGVRGYGLALVGFYAAPGELDGDYTLTLSGSVSANWDGDRPTRSRAFSSSDPDDADELAAYVLAALTGIDSTYVTASVDGRQLLTLAGTGYIEAALPSPQRYLEALFLLRSSIPGTFDLSPPQPADETYTDRANERIAGTLLEDAADAIAADLGISKGVAIGVGALMVIAGLFIYVVQGNGPAAIPFAFMISAIALVGATFVGLPVIILAMFILGAVLIMSWFFFFRGAT